MLRQAGAALSNYDDVDDVAEETQLEAYTTIIDEEDSIDEYWAFKELLSSMLTYGLLNTFKCIKGILIFVDF